MCTCQHVGIVSDSKLELDPIGLIQLDSSILNWQLSKESLLTIVTVVATV